jgi:hypothetical protein
MNKLNLYLSTSFKVDHFIVRAINKYIDKKPFYQHADKNDVSIWQITR